MIKYIYKYYLPGRQGMHNPYLSRTISPVSSSTLINRTGCNRDVNGDIGRKPHAPT
jgi:hypothetical protein